MRPDHGPMQSRRLGGTKRKKMTLSSESLVNLRFLNEHQGIPLVIEPAIEGVDAVELGTLEPTADRPETREPRRASLSELPHHHR